MRSDSIVYRKDVVEALYQALRTQLKGTFTDSMSLAISMAKALPSVEPKTGKWIVDDEYIDCSHCRREKWSRVPYEQLVSGFRFCPNCGAKMEVENGNDVH